MFTPKKGLGHVCISNAENSTTARTTLQKTLFYLHKPEIFPPLVYFKDFQSAKGLEMVINQFTIICVQ